MIRNGIAVIGAAALVVLAGCSGPTAPPDQGGGTVTIGRVDPSGQAYSFAFDRFINDHMKYDKPGSAVYDSLVDSEETLADGRVPIPRLATAWSFSDDFLTLSLTIRQGVEVSDGSTIDAEAVKASLDVFVPGWAWVPEDIVVTGDYTLDIEFADPPYPYDVIDQMDNVPVTSIDALADLDSLRTTPVGSGPYTYDEAASTPGQEYVFHKKSDYWDSDRYPFETVVWKDYPDNVSALNALKTGQIDFVGIDKSAASEVEASGLQVVEATGSWVGLILDRTGASGNAAFADIRVRQAINMAFDRESIVENIERGFGEVSEQIFLEGQREYRPDREGEAPYDPDEAKRLLAEAGYPDGFDVTIPSGYYTDYEPIVQQSLADIGIRVTFEPVLPEDFLVVAGSQKYEIQLAGNASQASVPFYITPPPSGIVNPFPVDDPDLLTWLDERKFGDPETSRAASENIGDYVIDNVWFVTFDHPKTLYAAIPELEVEVNNVTSIRSELWQIRPAE